MAHRRLPPLLALLLALGCGSESEPAEVTPEPPPPPEASEDDAPPEPSPAAAVTRAEVHATEATDAQRAELARVLGAHAELEAVVHAAVRDDDAGAWYALYAISDYERCVRDGLAEAEPGERAAIRRSCRDEATYERPQGGTFDPGCTATFLARVDAGADDALGFVAEEEAGLGCLIDDVSRFELSDVDADEAAELVVALRNRGPAQQIRSQVAVMVGGYAFEVWDVADGLTQRFTTNYDIPSEPGEELSSNRSTFSDETGDGHDDIVHRRIEYTATDLEACALDAETGWPAGATDDDGAACRITSDETTVFAFEPDTGRFRPRG